jgi:hypothetical protein
MMSAQEKFKRMQEATKARKSKEASSSVLPTPPPSVATSIAVSPSAEVVGEKRGPEFDVEEQRHPKSSRVEGPTMLEGGLHQL